MGLPSLGGGGGGGFGAGQSGGDTEVVVIGHRLKPTPKIVRSLRSRACAILSSIQASGRGTLQLGAAVNIAGGIGPISGSIVGGGGVAIDGSGNVARYSYHGVGGGTGLSAGFGGSVQVSNAKNVNDLGGPFLNFSGSGGDGAGGTADFFQGPSPDGVVTGGGVTGPVQGGAGAFVGRTNTTVGSSFNPLSALQGALGC